MKFYFIYLYVISSENSAKPPVDQDEVQKEIMDLKNENEKIKAELHLKIEENKKLQELIHKIEQEQSNEHRKIPQSKQIKILDSNDVHELEKIHEIGSGSGGKVFKVYTKAICALKEMNVSGATIDDFKKFINEYEIMIVLNHPNILEALGIFFGDEIESPKILLKYYPNNLEKAIKNKLFSKVQIVISIYQIVEGMKYIHFQKIIHRDLKPSNILISEDGTIKIGDFGISKLMSTEELQTMTIGIGTQKYMAPEIIDESDYGDKIDVYSFGVLVFFALNNGDISKIKISDILRGKKPQIPESFTSFARKLINDCLSFDANNRPNFSDILNDLERNNYNLVELTRSEIDEVKNFVKHHKEKIPSFY